MTAVANTAFTAAQFNLYVRDNLNTTPAALATVAGRLFVSTGVNAIAERDIVESAPGGSDTTASTTFTDLAGGAGPSVTITTGTQALVWLGCVMSNSGANGGAMGFAVSGATTTAASTGAAYGFHGAAGAAGTGVWFGRVTLTAGTNTFTAKYLVSAGTGTFNVRHVGVMAL